MSTAKPAIQKLESVTLLKDHTHAGTRYGKGVPIEVNAADKQWLIAQAIIAAPSAPAAAASTEQTKE